MTIIERIRQFDIFPPTARMVDYTAKHGMLMIAFVNDPYIDNKKVRNTAVAINIYDNDEEQKQHLEHQLDRAIKHHAKCLGIPQDKAKERLFLLPNPYQ